MTSDAPLNADLRGAPRRIMGMAGRRTSAHRGTNLEYSIGASLALAVSLLATFVGFDRDRAFYPTVLNVIASYYALFAVMGGSAQALIVESVVMAGFLLISILGFKGSLWLVVAGLSAHGLFDCFTALSYPIPVCPCGGRCSA